MPRRVLALLGMLLPMPVLADSVQVQRIQLSGGVLVVGAAVTNTSEPRGYSEVRLVCEIRHGGRPVARAESVVRDVGYNEKAVADFRIDLPGGSFEKIDCSVASARPKT